MRWGTNNAFPQTLKNLIEQSPSAKPAVSRTAKFYKGAGFEGEDTIVHPTGLTIKECIDYSADELAEFGGFAVHCNFNIKGEVVSMRPMSLTDLRFNQLDEINYASKFGYHPNFGMNSEIQKTIIQTPTRGKIKWIDRFNPKAVLKQIEKSEKIGNYSGQILYYSNAGFSSYPIPPLQSSINYVLSDVENSILVRKETATGFVNSYILKTAMDSEDESLIALERALTNAQGARGNGKIVTFAGLSPDEVQATLLEEIGSGSAGRATTIQSCRDGYELSKEVILGSYLIPPILGGVAQNSGWSTDELEDAYKIFNAITQKGRDILEQQYNRILSHSIFQKDIGKLQINKLKFDNEEKQN